MPIKRPPHRRIFEAVEFAARAHRGQTRKGTRVPYLLHPLRAGETLIRLDCPDDLVIAAILHDTVEDTATTFATIRKKFGQNVMEIVKACTEPDKHASWEERKRHTLETLRHAPLKILMVAAADKLDNVRAMTLDYQEAGESLWRRFKRPRAAQRWYYEGLAAVFHNRMADRKSRRLFGQFIKTVEQMFQPKNGSSAAVFRSAL
jgi:(p)ppGpp synthase/HD superfamily hydrolase